MKLKLLGWFLLVFAAALPAVSPLNAQTNVASAATNDTLANAYLQIQQQLHANQLALEQSRLAAAEEAKKNADALAVRLQSLEQAVAAQHTAETEAARRTQQITLLITGVFGLAGLGILLLMVYFQWRAFEQIGRIAAQQNALIASASAVQQLAGPGRATVETSNTRLLDVVSRLEQRIQELESGQRLLPEIAAVKGNDWLVEGQKFLESGAPQKALEYFEKFLAVNPDHAETLVKKAVALEKLGRDPDALVCCDRAIAVNGKLVIAHLHKGGLLNRLRRYDEALNCYEQALQAQEKKA